MNVVFDLGGVVVPWSPAAIVASVFDDPDERALALGGIFADPDWVALDRGVLPPDEAIARAALRTDIAADRVSALFDAMPRSLVPIPATIALVGDLPPRRQPPVRALEPPSLVPGPSGCGVRPVCPIRRAGRVV